ncbi:TraR/DksA C4-type zinc finger protein [Acinetobacter puyangensis]|uniref:Transcriptional regulator, TraR/DksA family n=1 Tax=Acinetobacter puyangensis TaxID=1096779 RepID=A0A240E627_9GAMM|nr:TraR/DksA C4-type zinc finger protein [Acinetobacter puyangensis]SNX44214.1 transcriptional regulator, TraR/DksA family [Acinetobacter puyangensis]
MSDEIDKANDLAEMLLKEQILNRVIFNGISLLQCEECGDEIPEQRRNLGGVRLCVECQSLMERKPNRFR